MQESFSARHHPFEGCFNFRDIGGYSGHRGRTLKWGRYYRAGRQDRMTRNDLERVRTFGIKTQIDLRGADEIADQGRGPLEGMGATYHHLPVIPEGGRVRLSQLVGDTRVSGQRYLGYLEFGPETWLRMFDIFADPASTPLVIHCTAGKDRTGVSTALLLSVLGVDKQTIEADYRFTNLDVPRQTDFVERTQGFPEGLDRTSFPLAAGVPEDAIGDFLSGLEERYGSAVDYLRTIGIADSTMDAVRTVFLEG